jgi:Protein of unknown function (DUF732)
MTAPKTRLSLILLSAGMLATEATLWFAPPAKADPSDARFVQQLAGAGIHITDPPPLVGNAARMACQLLQDNWTVATTSYYVKSEYPSLSGEQDRTFVLLAQKNYCPNA